MDKYSLSARIYPVAILFTPLVVLGIAYSFKFESYIQVLSSIGLSTALIYFLSNIGRDYGKKIESKLWRSWGGMPTIQLLSWSNSIIDPITKKRYHDKLQELLPVGKSIDFDDSKSSEVQNIYKAWTKFLITNTRDTKKYPLIFKENINYGFRRNLWGLKPFGILLILLSILGNYIYQAISFGLINFKNYSLEFYLSEFILILLLLIWASIIVSNWVKVPAFSYAERLLEAIESL